MQLTQVRVLPPGFRMLIDSRKTSCPDLCALANISAPRTIQQATPGNKFPCLRGPDCFLDLLYFTTVSVHALVGIPDSSGSTPEFIRSMLSTLLFFEFTSLLCLGPIFVHQFSIFFFFKISRKLVEFSTFLTCIKKNWMKFVKIPKKN